MDDDEKIALALAIHDILTDFRLMLVTKMAEFDTTELDIATKFDYEGERYDLIVKKRDRYASFLTDPRDIEDREQRAANWVWAFIRQQAGEKISVHPSDFGVSYDDWLDIREVLTKVIPADAS